jgi:pyruvate/2-oxoglutarate dehydrogenase complex dihydrolipoamide acyltransferase (E2) component
VPSDQSSPLSINRRMAAASAAVCRERDTIHPMTEVDVSKARRLLRELRDDPEGGVSLTAYIVASLARAVAEHRELNSLVTRGRLVLLDDVTFGVLVERIVAGEPVPEPVAIKGVDKLTVRQITDTIRAAQQAPDRRLGGLSGATWVRFVPAFLFKAMIRWASRSVRMARRYGVISVTSTGGDQWPD